MFLANIPGAVVSSLVLYDGGHYGNGTLNDSRVARATCGALDCPWDKDEQVETHPVSENTVKGYILYIFFFNSTIILPIYMCQSCY